MSDDDLEILEETSYHPVPISTEFHKKHPKIFNKSNLEAIERVFSRCSVNNFEKLEDNIGRTRAELDQATQWYHYEAKCHKQYKTNYETLQSEMKKVEADNSEHKNKTKNLEILLEETREAYGKISKTLFSKLDKPDNNDNKENEKQFRSSDYVKKEKYDELLNENIALDSVNTQLKERVAKLEVQLARNKGTSRTKYYR